MEKLLNILSNYRITLPKDFREKFNMQVGDHVKAVWDGEYLMILPVNVEVKARVKVTIEGERWPES